jgi:HupE / UreJ protein
MIFRCRGALAVLAWTCAVAPLLAHDISRSESTLTVHGPQVDAVLTIGLSDFHKLPDVDRNHDGMVSYDELDNAIEPLYAAVREHFTVRSGSASPTRTTVERYVLLPDGRLRLEIVYQFAEDVRALRVESTLDAITQSDHQHLATAAIGGIMHDAILTAEAPVSVFENGPRAYAEAAQRFLRLGLTTMLMGPAHLAFLIALLIPARQMRSVVIIIASLTIAQSLALALAAYGAVNLPARLIDGLIAASIALVALENLLRTEPIARPAVTFVFGVAHGVGLASALRNLQLPRESLAFSTLFFGAGVEAGVLIVCLALFLLLHDLGRSPQMADLRRVLSVGAASYAMYWFIQRGFLS